MDSNAVNELNGLIDYIASKFSVTSQYLVEAMSGYYLTRNLTNSIISLIILIAFIIVCYKQPWRKSEEEVKKMSRTDSYEYGVITEIYTMLSCIVIVVASALFIINLSQLIGILASPEGYTIAKILEALHGSAQ
jgi:hypothetical protein